MFRADPSLSHVAASRGQVVSIIQSINHPHVAVPGHSTQAGEGTVVGVRNAGGSFSIFAHLYLTESKTAVIYGYESPEFDVESYSAVEGEAIEFLESMGFMVDNLNFRNLSSLQQEELMSRLPCFDPDPGAGEAEAEDDSDAVELEALDDVDGRLPSSFEAAQDELEELDEVEDLEELEPLEPLPGSAADEIRSVSSDSAVRVGRLLGSF